LAFISMLAFAAGGAAQVESKIGFVNLDRILRDAAPAQRAQKKIESEFSKREQELAKMAESLKRMQETLEKNSMTMSESDRRNREREFREDLNQRRNEELSGILERANRVVRQIAESEKFDVIFQEAVYASPRIDITDKVIRALDDTGTGKK
jgi:outer membrane protein